ncbi:MAG: hypothetical protein HZA50_09930 [Planctomycetes bacterium]|nr:hypothetical protein [Planctomycetota bacterium]
MLGSTRIAVFAAIGISISFTFADNPGDKLPGRAAPAASQAAKVRTTSRPAASTPAVDPDSPLGKAATMHKAHIDKLYEAARALADAHARLDQGSYDQAILLHKAARALEDEAAKLKREFDRQMEALVSGHLKALDSDDYSIRETATAELIKMGIYAIPKLKKAMEKASPEARSRMEMAIARMAGVVIDEKGRLHQWAADAAASSEYGVDEWSAFQATGEPDTFKDGDSQTAWASKEADGGEEWLELTYDQPVRPVRIRIHETFNPGAVTRVEGKDDRGKWHTIWEGKDTVKQAPGYLEVEPKAPATWPCKIIKITLDSAAVAGWNEIDAVELIGEPAGIITTTQPKPPQNRQSGTKGG